MSLSIYNLCLILCSPLILLSYLIKLYKRPDYRPRWAERLGCFPPVKKTGGLHIHAVSLGEAKVAAKVLSELLAQHPELPVVFTCSTATASEFIQRQFGDTVDHCYLPFDFPWIVADFLNRYQPKICVITEVEWWPNLINQHARKGNPVVIINAKMTSSSAKTYQKFRRIFDTMSVNVDHVLVQNQNSWEQFQQLGLNEKQLQLTNNIKFDEQPSEQTPEFIGPIKTAFADRPVWVAGSTHAEDEAVVLEAFSKLKEKHSDLLLILVPRHPERFERVYEHCNKHGFRLSRRSQNQAVTTDTDILLGDTLGELGALYALADMAFIGGSITDRGGHNPLEAAIYGVPLVMGPSQYNSADIVESLAEAGALQVVEDSSELYQILEQWLNNAELRLAAGASCSKAFTENQGALAKTLDVLNPLITHQGQP